MRQKSYNINLKGSILCRLVALVITMNLPLFVQAQFRDFIDWYDRYDRWNNNNEYQHADNLVLDMDNNGASEHILFGNLDRRNTVGSRNPFNGTLSVGAIKSEHTQPFDWYVGENKYALAKTFLAIRLGWIETTSYSQKPATDTWIMSLLKNGNVGVGTTSPLAKFDILGGADNNGGNDPKAMAFQWRGGGYRHWVSTRHNSASSDGNAIDFYLNTSGTADGSSAPGTGSTLGMTVSALGVGIGTNAPGQKLDVAGTVQATGFKLTTGAGAGKVLVSDASGVASWSTLSTTSGASSASGWTLSGSNPTTTGNVGIGTTSPLAKFDILGGADNNGGNDPKAMAFQYRAGGYRHWISTRHINVANSNQNAIDFYLNNSITGDGSSAPGTGTSHGMTISATGVGIGTTSPTAKLEVGQDDALNTITVMRVHGGAVFNNDADVNHQTKVRINTNKYVTNTALTVGGPTYIGSWQGAESGVETTSAVASSYLTKYYLWVEKGIVSEDFVYSPKTAWRDEVFQSGYKLPKLGEVEQFIKENKHLPGIPSEQEVKEKGYSNHELNKALLEKIEHLVLYSIEQEKQIKELKLRLNAFEEKLKK